MSKKFTNKRKPIRELSSQQYEQYKLYRETRTLKVHNESSVHLLTKLYAHVFAIQYNSNSLMVKKSENKKILFRMSKELDIVFETYKKEL